MITEHYPIRFTRDRKVFLFESVGVHGTIRKAVIFEEKGNDYYNLAFGDIVNQDLKDEIISNNQDVLKVMSTVAKAIYIFFEFQPNAILEIEAVDQKRLNFYNTIFKRRFSEIEKSFILRGYHRNSKEEYKPDKFYDKFEIELKKS